MPKTVLLTGVSGFIAKRIALDLLNAGYTVRGSLRSTSRVDEVQDAARGHLTDAGALERLNLVELDLTRDEGWAEAMEGVDVLMHTASPFPLAQPKNEDDLIRPAVDGTLRALRAAQTAGVTRVILTSSVVAIEAKPKQGAYTEEDWSETTHPKSSAYSKSKTLAERAAWEFVDAHPEMQLTTVNPALVMGAPLDDNYGTSLSIVERILAGKDPMVPNIGFGLVDVADVSAMHIAAMERPDSVGHRFIACAGSMTMPEMARRLALAYPDRGIATRIAPVLFLKFLSLFDASIKTILPGIGDTPQFDNTRARDGLGIRFTDPATALDLAAAAVVAKA